MAITVSIASLWLRFIELFVGAAATLPLIAVLTIAAGRRANGALCIFGARALLRLCLFCWPAGLLYYALSYFTQVWHYGNSPGEMLAPLLAAPGRPWLSAFSVWFAGGIAAGASLFFLRLKGGGFKGERYLLRNLRLPVWTGLAAALCFFAALCLVNWPFAGLPQDFPMDRAVMAILRNAMRNYFMDFCPAGAFALAGVFFLSGRIPEHDLPLAIRWPAIWAAAGALPHILHNWGMLAGLGMSDRLGGALAQGHWTPTLALICLTLAAFAWCWIIWKPRTWQVMGMAGLGLLLLATGAPLLLALAR